jgi:hypothetical protein
MVAGCAGAAKMAKPSDSVQAPKKFDLGEFYFKWVILFPLEIIVGIPSGTLFMTREEVHRKFWKAEPLPNERKEEKRDKNLDWLRKIK